MWEQVSQGIDRRPRSQHLTHGFGSVIQRRGDATCYVLSNQRIDRSQAIDDLIGLSRRKSVDGPGSSCLYERVAGELLLPNARV
jgi:hypothetical protein